MTKPHILVPAVLAAALATVATAQKAPPFTAKTRTVQYLVSSDGHKKMTSIELGTYSRSSAGVTLARHHAIVRGKVMPDEAILTGADGSLTRIEWGQRLAILLQDGRPGYVRPALSARGQRRTMYGVSCIVVPIAVEGCLQGNCAPPPAPLKSFGCVSPEYGTMVYSDVLATPPPGAPPMLAGIRETVSETYGFENHEPDPASMAIPVGFALRRAAPAGRH